MRVIFGAIPVRSFAAYFLVLACCAVASGAILHYEIAPDSDIRGEGQIQSNPETVGLPSVRMGYIDEAVETAIEAGELPGAVVVVARHGRIAYFKAFGNRSIQPETESMTVDTIFDMSSLTKVVATTPSIMLLVEKGALRLGDPVKRYLPKFKGRGKDRITVSQLLTHYSGLPPDFDLGREWFGHEAALEELWSTKTISEPGSEFRYSDINFITLGEIVNAVSGKTLDVFAQENVFLPLGMTETFFNPDKEVLERVAPTESRARSLRYLNGKSHGESMNEILRGEVHDPTAWRMGGIAGHAGLFSSARDLAIYAQMLLDQGIYKGKRVLSSRTIQAMTAPQSPGSSPQVRGYGWDLKSDYSSPRGDIFKGGYGHTGFTGTSLWIHPPTDTFIILLSNRVHPDGGESINHLRAAIANIVATAISDFGESNAAIEQ
jgi:CubicO group peptidase (beta-lactamase class C family)